VFTAKADVDQARARRVGVTSKDVADALDFFVDGWTTTDYHQGNVDIPIVGRGVMIERDSPDSLRTLGIRTATGGSVPLNQVADVYTVGELDRIMRYNQERTITVSAKNQVLKASEIFAGIKPTLDGMNFPKKHYWEKKSLLGGGGRTGRRSQGPEESGQMDAAVFWRHYIFTGLAV